MAMIGLSTFGTVGDEKMWTGKQITKVKRMPGAAEAEEIFMARFLWHGCRNRAVNCEPRAA